eukprot:m.112355 g.112355  ORF g.112355 m.112355 type:complete len:68 (-) comp13472_c0_seq1:515-718(-)
MHRKQWTHAAQTASTVCNTGSFVFATASNACAFLVVRFCTTLKKKRFTQSTNTVCFPFFRFPALAQP